MRIVKKIFQIKKRYLFVITIIVLVGAWIIFSPKAKKEPIEYASVSYQNLQTIVSASGTLQGKDTATLKFQTSGTLKFISVKEGDLVKKGQVIAGLDTQSLSSSLEQAQNSLRDKQAQVDYALDQVKNHDTDETLLQRQTRTTAEVARDNAYESVKIARDALRHSTLFAPIAGVVTQAQDTSGQLVSATDTIAQIVDQSQIYFDVEVDEADIGKVSVGQSAQVTLNTYENKTFDGKVEKIIPSTKTTTSGATVVIVRINLGSPQITFVPGLNGQVSIITQEKQNALSISQDSLVQKDSVYLKTDGVIREQKITTGFSGDTNIEVTSGLSENNQVVKNPGSVSPSDFPGGGNFFTNLFKKRGS